MRHRAGNVCLFMLLAGCGTRSSESIEALPNDRPDNFDISLSYGIHSASEINTYNDTYTKDLVEDDVTTQMELTDEELDVIYEKMKEVDILNNPELINEDPCTIPHAENHLTVTVDGVEVQRDWITAQCDDPKEAEQLLESFVNTIHQDIVGEREEYEALPDAYGGYH